MLSCVFLVREKDRPGEMKCMLKEKWWRGVDRIGEGEDEEG